MALSEEKTGKEVATAVEGDESAADEDCSPEFTPIVKLEEVVTVKGDENETIVWENKCKLYRFDVDVWKERGLGQAKILKHKANHKQRFVMHEDKTLKLRANHLILPDTKLKEHGGNEKALVFSTIDFADEKQKEESFCIRFGTAEKAQEFRTVYEAAIKENAEYQKSNVTEGEEVKEEEVEDSTSPAAKAPDESSEVEKLGEELQSKAVVAEESKSEDHH